MLSKEEIEKAKGKLQEIKEFWINYNYATEEGKKSLIENADTIETLLQYIDQLEQENKTLKHINKIYNGIINKQSEQKKKVLKELNKRMCNFADTLKPEAVLKYSKIEMKDIDNNTYELLAVYTLGLLGEIYKIVKEEV